MYVFKDELDDFEEKFAKTIWNFLSKRSDPDLVQLFWVRIRPGQKVPDLQNLAIDPLLNWMSAL